MLIGTDIEEVKRFELLNPDDSFVLHNFNKLEIEHAEASGHFAESLAGIWCAKEAIIKAMSGMDVGGVLIKDIEIGYGLFGAPWAVLTGEHKPNGMNSKTIRVSISHTKKYATATAIIYGGI